MRSSDHDPRPRAASVKSESMLRSGLGCDSLFLELDHGSELFVGPSCPDFGGGRDWEFVLVVNRRAVIPTALKLDRSGTLDVGLKGPDLRQRALAGRIP